MSYQPTARHWINGEFATTGVERAAINPANGEVIGCYFDGGVAEAEHSIAAASRVFRDSEWKNDGARRSAALGHLANAFESRADDLAALISLENGKIAPEARFEVSMLSRTLRFQAGLAMQTFGRVLESKPGSMSMVLREPIGISGHIIPWNSPAVLFVRSIAPALAAGTTAVVKMPSQCALVATLMAEIIASVNELPKGAVNIFIESGSEGARHIVDSPLVPAVSFTGSTATGRAIAQAAAPQFKRLGLELGGKGPHLVFDDADLESALPKIEKSLTVFAGQFCMTAGRLLVQRGVADGVRERLAARLEAVTVGPASDPTSGMGPLIDKRSVERVEQMVKEAIASGAKVILRGGAVTEGPLACGAFYRPTLLEISDHSMRIAREEVFGPVQVLQVFDTEEEAIALANDSEYGLSASVWSRDADRGMRIARRLETGLVSINDWINFGVQFEIGGVKASGLGRMGGLGSIDGFLEYKQIGHVYRTAGVV
ncbi:aldehyde dehydrogenase family protein [Variovorax humicola]|uniref:Aldehyde dehydrogenase family protein n=1 Tax=Variovorax humicola TaxID=1769758 RepID=A0ABU8W374_9BURK